jgi:hypothetical protein
MIPRGILRKKCPDIFLSHSSKDKIDALQLARIANFCGIDVWLDDWELSIGSNISDELSKALNNSRYVAILLTDNYNKTVWTKREYQEALAREEKEKRNVLLPILTGSSEMPPFMGDRKFIDMRYDYYAGIARLAGFVHEFTEYRVNEAIRYSKPENLRDVWNLLRDIGWKQFIVLGKDDFDEVVQSGAGTLASEDFARYSTNQIMSNEKLSPYLKRLFAQIV